MRSWSDVTSLVRIEASLHNGESYVGAGVLVAPDWVLTAAHVLDSTFGVDARERGALSEGQPPATIVIRWREHDVTLHPRAADILFATRSQSGVGETRDLALIRLPRALSVARVEPLCRFLGEAERTAQPEGKPRVVLAGFPNEREKPRIESFHAAWDPDDLNSEAARIVTSHGGVAHGFSGGPLFLELPDESLAWIGVSTLGGEDVGGSGYVLARDIAAFLDAASKQPGFESLRDGRSETDLRRRLLLPELKLVAKLCATLPMEYAVKLDSVYEQRVVDDEGESSPDPEAQRAAIGPTTLERRMFPDVDEAAATGATRLIIKGLPGCGKTTLARHTCWSLANRFVQGASEQFAIYVRLPDVCDAFAKLATMEAALLKSIENASGPYSRELFKCDEAPVPAALVLDGLDETPKDPTVRSQVRSLIGAISATKHRWRIVVATRPTGFNRHSPEFAPFRVLAIDPLRPEKALPLIERVVGAYREKTGQPDLDLTATRAWYAREVQSNPAYADERGNPLWLTLTALHVAEHSRPPTSRTELLGSILTMLESGRIPRNPAHDPGSMTLPAAGRRVLELLALRMTELGVVQLSRLRLEQLLNELAEDPSTRPAVNSLESDLNGPRKSFFDLLHDLSILAPPAGATSDAPWCFWHRSLLEYLTSRALLARWSKPAEREKLLELARDAVARARDSLIGELHEVAQAIARHQEGTRFLSWSHTKEAEERGAERVHAQIAGMTKEGWRSNCETWSSNEVRQFIDRYRDSCSRWSPPIELPEPPEADHDESIRFWGEPLGLLAESLTDPAESCALLETLVVAPDIARRSLLAAGRASERAIRLVLDAHEDEEQRGAILSQVPRLLGDIETSVRVLSALGRESRHRSDLYFIDEALTALGATHDQRTRDKLRAARAAMYRELVHVDVAALVASLRWSTIPRGEYLIGDGVDVRVSIREELRMSSVTVTRAEYSVFAKSSYSPAHAPSPAPTNPARLPAYEVSWYAATAYARWLGWVLEGAPGRLPTEQEWEVACRAGSPAKQRWWNGDDPERLGEVAYFNRKWSEGPFEVGDPRHANAWGLSDMHGNVWEWCSDVFERGPWRVVRGGGCGDAAVVCRSAFRNRNLPAYRFGNTGFRVVLPAAPARGSSLDL